VCYDARMLGIPRGRIPVAIAMVALLAFILSALQGRFNSTDVKKGIALAMGHRPSPSGPTLFEALAARGEGDPRCDGSVVSTLLGDIDVRCSTPGKPSIEYDFRVLLDGKRPPRAANPPAQEIFNALAPGQ